MEIKKNHDLSFLNTFGIKARAKFFVEVRSEEELNALFQSEEFKENSKFFLGGGSNILFVKDFDGLVILNKLKGIQILNENQNEVTVRSVGGEVWNDLVTFTTDRNLWGIENLAFIPGTVGAAPVQNIGAYGRELKDVLENVECIYIKTGEKKIFTKKECEFGYRDSVFKNKFKDQFFILAITLKLSKIEQKNISYKVLQDYIKEKGIQINSSKDVADAVTAIRKSKLPDPEVIPNAGSFFKNIVLDRYKDKEKIEKLFSDNPDMPHFKEENSIKIPSGYLIEQCGWKGRRIGNVGVHDKQALVLVNYGGASGKEIIELSEKIIADVKQKFGLNLVREVNLI